MNRAVLEFNINEDCLLIDFLKNNMDKSKNNIKSFISNGCCFVNDKVVVKANYLLKKDDTYLRRVRYIFTERGNQDGK